MLWRSSDTKAYGTSFSGAMLLPADFLNRKQDHNGIFVILLVSLQRSLSAVAPKFTN